MHLLNALLAELYELLRDFVFCCVLLYTVLPPMCSTTLRSFLEPTTSANVPSWHVFVQIPQNPEVHSMHWFSEPAVFYHTLLA
jgi:hypothetical protein